MGAGYGGYGYGGNCGYGFGGAAGAAGIGGFLGAILGNGGLFGDRDRRDGRFDGRGEGCCRGTEIILDDAHYNSLTNNIGQVKAEVGAIGGSIKAEIGNKFEHQADRFNAFELAWCQANGATNMAIANGTFQGALNTKDIIHDLDTKICMTNRNIDQTKFELSKQMSDCCCENLRAIEGIKTFMIQDELAEERAKRRDLENTFRIGNIVSNSVRATTNGSNFNTGTQTSQNNSGQLIGA